MDELVEGLLFIEDAHHVVIFVMDKDRWSCGRVEFSFATIISGSNARLSR